MGLFNLFKQKENKINKNSDRNLKESEPLSEKKLLKRIKRSKDENELMEIIIESSSTIVRDNAFNVLKNLIRTDFSKTPYFTKDDFPDLDSREMAEASYDQITNQKQIEELAILSNSELAKKTCIPKIENSKLLSVIALMDNNSHARVSAIANDHFNNNKILFHLAQNDNDGYVRVVATSIINNQDELMTIAQKNTISEARLEAVKKIESNSVLTEIFLKEQVNEVLEGILWNDNFTNQEILEKVAMGKVRKYKGMYPEKFLRRITDKEMLQEYALKLDHNSPEWMHLLNNEFFDYSNYISILEEVALNKNLSARKDAIICIENINILERILFGEDEELDIKRLTVNRFIQLGTKSLQSYAEKVEGYEIKEFIKRSIEIQNDIKTLTDSKELEEYYKHQKKFDYHSLLLNQIEDKIDSISKNNEL